MAITEIDEKLLVRAYQAGNERAFDTIVRTQYNALYAHALRRLSQHEAAEDAVQDTLMRAYRALPKLDGDLALRAWLHRILTNVCHDEGNRRRRQQGIVEKVGALPEELADDASEEAVLHDTVRVMSEALQDLPESYREALVLRYVDGLSFREVAEATGTTEENARARAHRGRLALHKVLSRVMVLLAFVIPGLRRTHDVAGPGSEQAVGTGVSDHTVSLATQLTSHAMQSAPAMSRLAEVASGLPSGKGALAAAAMTAVAAVSVPVAVHQVNEARSPERPPAAVAPPAVTRDPDRTTTTSKSNAAALPPTTSTTLPRSQAEPFVEDPQVSLGLVTPRVPPTTTSTTTVAPTSPAADTIDGHFEGEALEATGESPQYDLKGDVELAGFDKRGHDQRWDSALTGRFFVHPDGDSSADDVVFELDDGTKLTLRYRGTVLATSQEDGTARYEITGTYVLDGADAVGLADHGDITATLVLQVDGTASLALELSGQDQS